MNDSSASRWPLAVLVVAIMWAPVPLASNRDWAIGLLAMLVWSGVLGALLARLVSQGTASWRWSTALPLACVAGFVALVVRQAWLGLPATADVYQTRVYLLTSLVHLGALSLTLLACRSARHATTVLMAVVASAVLQATVAVVLYSTGAAYLFLFTDFQQGSRATGTYPNPDHLAGFMELGLSAGLGLLLAQFQGGEPGNTHWRSRLLASLTFLLSGKMVLRLTLVVMVVALVMTHSRMGNAAFFLALLLTGLVVASASRQLRRPALWLTASMVLVDVVIIGQWVGLDRVVERLQGTAQSTAIEMAAEDAFKLSAPAFKEESIQQRLTVPRLSLPLIDEKPLWGFGGGSYYLAFPNIKPAGFPHLWDHAHNDYVEIAVDTGLPGLGLLLVFALATLAKSVSMLGDKTDRRLRGVAVSALMALVCMGMHSMVDFNLQIPANAMVLVVLMALVWAAPDSGHRPANGTHKSNP